MLEAEGYREQLKEITEFFTDEKGESKRLLSAVDVARYLGIHRTRAAKLYNISRTSNPGITTVELARRLTK